MKMRTPAKTSKQQPTYTTIEATQLRQIGTNSQVTLKVSFGIGEAMFTGNRPDPRLPELKLETIAKRNIYPNELPLMYRDL